MSKKQHSKRSVALGDFLCPKCKQKGQLKMRITGKGDRYFQMDHYKNPNWHGSGYSHSCYLRTATEIEYAVKELKRYDGRHFLRDRIEQNVVPLAKQKYKRVNSTCLLTINSLIYSEN